MPADCKAFKEIQCERHCLRHRPQNIETGCQALRKRRHNLFSPLSALSVVLNRVEKSFIPRCLYAFNSFYSVIAFVSLKIFSFLYLIGIDSLYATIE